MKYNEYLKSVEWKVLSRLARESAENRCKVCGSGIELHVHHREYPAILGTESLSDLVVLCKKCHSLFHAAEHTSLPARSCDNCGTTEEDLYSLDDHKKKMLCKSCLSWEYEMQEMINYN